MGLGDAIMSTAIDAQAAASPCRAAGLPAIRRAKVKRTMCKWTGRVQPAQGSWRYASTARQPGTGKAAMLTAARNEAGHSLEPSCQVRHAAEHLRSGGHTGADDRVQQLGLKRNSAPWLPWWAPAPAWHRAAASRWLSTAASTRMGGGAKFGMVQPPVAGRAWPAAGRLHGSLEGLPSGPSSTAAA